MAPPKSNKRRKVDDTNDAEKSSTISRKTRPAGKLKQITEERDDGTAQPPSDDFLFALIQELHEVVTKIDVKQIQSALHELSDSNRKSPVLAAVSSANSFVFSSSSVATATFNEDAMEIAPSNDKSSRVQDYSISESNNLITKREFIGYLVVLATHTLERLISISQKTNDLKHGPVKGKSNAGDIEKDTDDNKDGVDHIIIIMAWISFYLSYILSTAKVERFTSSSTPGSRQVYGRALLISTAASSHALKALTYKSYGTQESPTSDTVSENDLRICINDSQTCYAWQACVLTLDSLILPSNANHGSYAHTASSATSPSANSCSGSVASSAHTNTTPSANLTPSNSQGSPSAAVPPSQQVSVMWHHFKNELMQQLLFKTDALQKIENMMLVADSTDEWRLERNCLDSIVKSLRSPSEFNEYGTAKDSPAKKTKKKKSEIDVAGDGNDDVDRPQRIKYKAKKGASFQSISTAATFPLGDDNKTENLSTAPIHLKQMFQQMMHRSPSSQIKLDGRLAIKRWTAVALTWYCQGHSLLLHASLSVLLVHINGKDEKDPDHGVKQWKDYMDLILTNTDRKGNPRLSLSDVMSSSNSASKNIMESNSETLKGHTSSEREASSMPGNVTILWLACRLIRIVRDLGALAGSKPPTAMGLDVYMKSIFGIEEVSTTRYTVVDSGASTTKKGKKRSRAKQNAGLSFSNETTNISTGITGARLDIRNLSVVVSYHLIQAHHESLRLNIPFFAKSESQNRLVVNDELDFSVISKTVANPYCVFASPFFGSSNLIGDDLPLEQKHYYCYPFVHESLEDLSKAAASTAVLLLSSTSSSVTTASNCSFGGLLAAAGILGTDGPSTSSVNHPLVLTEQQSRWMEIFEYVAATYIVQAATQNFSDAAFDARLLQFSVLKLKSCLSTIITNSSIVRSTRSRSKVTMDTGDNFTSCESKSIFTSSTDSALDIINGFDILQPLPVPVLQSNANDSVRSKSGQISSAKNLRKRRDGGDVTNTKSASCISDFLFSFGGIGSDEEKHKHPSPFAFQNEEKLAIFLRAFTPETCNSTSTNASTLISSLMLFLLDIIESTYDTRSVESFPGCNLRNDDARKSFVLNDTRRGEAILSKHGTESIQPSRKSTRKRKSDNVDDCTPNTTIRIKDQDLLTGKSTTTMLHDAPSCYRPIKGIRSSLAKEAIEAVQLFLQSTRHSSISGNSSTSFRTIFGFEVISRIINLCPTLEKIINLSSAPHLTGVSGNAKNETATFDTLMYIPTNYHGRTRSERCANHKDSEIYTTLLSQDEKSLWSAHMELCITIGGGHDHIPHNVSLKKQLFAGEARIALYTQILNSHRLDRPFRADNNDLQVRWPLCLCEGHRLIMASNLANEEIAVDTSPDRLVVFGMVNELQLMLTKLSISCAEPSEVQHSGPDYTLTGIREKIPLSLHDTRLFLLAFSRLGPGERESSLLTLFAAVKNGLISIESVSKELLFSPSQDQSYIPSFLARVITLCVNAHMMMKFHPKARDELCLVLSQTTSTQPPSFRSELEPYCAEKSFVGVLGDSDDPRIPSSFLLGSSQNVNEKAEEMLEEILENVLTLAFAAARYDQGQLLFAAWNALGKRELWKKPLKVIKRVSEINLPLDATSLLLQLRDEICLVQSLIHQSLAGDSSTELATYLNFAENENYSRKKTVQETKAEVKDLLSSMVKKASWILDRIVDQYIGEEEHPKHKIPSSVFCLMEALSVYVSFAIASATIPKKDFFSTTLSLLGDRTKKTRSRAYSSDSENNACSETGTVDTNDDLVDTLDRIQDVCEHLGAVPAHPDWLDHSCCLWDGISYHDASMIAEEALRVLTKLVSVGFCHCQSAQWSSLTEAMKSRDGSVGSDLNSVSRKISLASQLCWLQNYETSYSVFGDDPSSRSERVMARDIGLVCDIDGNFLDFLLSDFAARQRHNVSGRWCTHSAHRILGRFHDVFRSRIVSQFESPELRAGSEWEVLLAGTLTSACIDSDRGKQNDFAISSQACSDVEDASRWLYVCWAAIDSMVPTAALLRYGVTSNARKSHPLSSVDTTIDWYETNGQTEGEDIDSNAIVATSALNDLVASALFITSRFPPSATCRTLASHLLLNKESFNVIQKIETSITCLHVLAEIRELAESNGSKECREAASYVADRVASVLELYGVEAEGSRNASLVSCLCSPDQSIIQTFLMTKLDFSEMKRHSNALNYFLDGSDNSLKTLWSIDKSNDYLFSKGLLPFVYVNDLFTNPQTRAFFIQLLTNLSLYEYEENVKRKNSSRRWTYLSLVVESFSKASNDQVNDLIANDVIGTREAQDSSPLSSIENCERLSELFSLLLVPSRASDSKKKFSKANLILDHLLDHKAFNRWPRQHNARQRRSILHMAFLYGCYTKRLVQVGTQLFNAIQSSSNDRVSEDIENLSFFFEFLLELKGALSKRPAGTTRLKVEVTPDIPSFEFPTSCTYASINDFHEQHWYNCETCGLVDDKGCCTLCALICHQGHDVSYSRFSSFFCDCGESTKKSRVGTDQVVCQCLSEQSQEHVLSKISRTDKQRLLINDVFTTEKSTPLNAEACATLAKSFFLVDTKRALNDLIEAGRSMDWTRSLLRRGKEEFKSWKSHFHPFANSMHATESKDSYEHLRSSIGCRKETFPEVTMFDQAGRLALLGASQAGTFEMKMTSDGASDRVKRNLLASKGLNRAAIDTDSRGRSVIAESGSLLFCSLLPFLNSKLLNTNTDTLLPRSSICTVGSALTEFGVIGLKFSRDFERHLAVWGTEEAKVLLMNEDLSGVDHCVYLDVGSIGNSEKSADCIINVHWLPGTKGKLVVASCHALRIFDLSTMVNTVGTVTPVQVIKHGTCDQFRDFAVVSIDNTHAKENKELCWKFFTLLINGRLKETSLTYTNGYYIFADDKAKIRTSDIEISLDKAGSIDITTDISGSIPSIDKLAPTKLSAQSKDYRLNYLQQSRLLVYQADKGPVMALQLDESGCIIGKIGLIPFEISAEILNRKEKKGIVGPYSNWTELGLFGDGKVSFFRVSCCGKNNVSGEPVFLNICFNDTMTKIEELQSNPLDLGFESSRFLEGSSAISFPYSVDDLDELNLYTPRQFCERVAVVFIAANGCCSIYVDDCTTRSAVWTIESLAELQPLTGYNVKKEIDSVSLQIDRFVPLTAFEKMKNVTGSIGFSLWGDGLGCSTSIRDKLRVDTELFLTHPSGDKFTFFVSSCEKKEASSEMHESQQIVQQSGSVLAAVRIHVGSRSIDSIPETITVQGRAKDVKAGAKRWYSFPLSCSEVALGIRNGFVTVEIGHPHDSTRNPVIDAIEIYAIEQNKIQLWLPTMLKTTCQKKTVVYQDSSAIPKNDRNFAFSRTLTALSQLASLLGSFEAGKDDILLVKQIIQDTALLDEIQISTAVKKLEESLYNDKDSRQSFHDKAVLFGCSSFLRQCHLKLEDSTNEFQSFWQIVVPSMHACLQIAAEIALHRSINYLQAADETPHDFGSIATDVSNVLAEYIARSNKSHSLVSEFVELSLLETAVAIGSKSTSEYSPRGHFGSFEGLARLLRSPNSSVVREVCISISDFCSKYSISKCHANGEIDLFKMQTMEVKYACDSCTKFIDDVRYTLLDDSHPFDLCIDCYHLAREYSSTNVNGPSTNVVIQGKCVGEGPTLTCEEVDLMKAVEIKKSKKKGIKENDSDQVSIRQRQQLFDDFLESLFTGVAAVLEEKSCDSNETSNFLMLLFADLVRHSKSSGKKFDRAKRAASWLVEGLRYRLTFKVSTIQLPLVIDNLPPIEEGIRRSIVVVFEALTSIINADVPIPNHTATEDVTTSDLDHSTENHYRKETAQFIWNLLCTTLQSHKTVEASLRVLIEDLIHNLAQFSGCIDLKHNNVTVMSDSSPAREKADFTDGTFCSRCRLQDISLESVLHRFTNASSWSIPEFKSFDSRSLLLQKSLELMSLVAGPTTSDSDRSLWFPVLCKAIVSDTTHDGINVRDMARHCLEQFCANRKSLSEAICDYYFFESRMGQILKCTGEVMKYSILLNEKARLCKLDWKSSKPTRWKSLSISSILGTTDLVSEDITTPLVNEQASNLLEEMLSLASTHYSNWRRFCGVRFNPSLLNLDSALDELLENSPVLILFALACSLNSDNQLKALRLLSLAFTKSDNIDHSVRIPPENQEVTGEEDEGNGIADIKESIEYNLKQLGLNFESPEGVLSLSIDDIFNLVVRFVCYGATSEIRNVAAGMSSKLCLVLGHQQIEVLLRRLLLNFPICEVGIMGKRYAEFLSLLQSLLKLHGSSSPHLTDAAALVQSLFEQQILAIRHDRTNGEYMYFETRLSGSVIKKRFDLASCVHCNSHWHKSREKALETSIGGSGVDRVTSSPSRGGNASESPASKTKWLQEQVSPFARGRLDSGKDSCTSSEFCTFYSLRRRFVISTLHLEINDPRNRFAKAIKIYFTPRPVAKPSILKSPEFSSKWQLCGEISLSRGATRATCLMTVQGRPAPILASNLKIEYSDFYERPGAAKNSDGSFIVHCPRCARTVTNAHGVCSNCGEVAFQCRKCRHINYDGLDAFFCVECGYCASGTFLYEVTAGVASNAVAITNDREYERMNEMLSIAAKMYEDIRAALNSKLLALGRSKRRSISLGDNEDLGFGSTAVARAYWGSLPTESADTRDHNRSFRLSYPQLGKAGSAVKLIAQPKSDGGDRNQSLFRIARQIRSDNASSRRSTDSLMIRHLGRTLHDDESASEFLGGLLEGSGTLSRIAVLDPSDPLSRLLASVQRDRRERREAEDRDESRLESTESANRKPVQNAKEALEECERLHLLLREVEREFSELNKKCKAWQRLEQGRIDKPHEDNDCTHFEPSHCSSCGGQVALHLLNLWLTLFHLNPDATVITNDFVAILLNDDTIGHMKALRDAKRGVVKDIAISSKHGSLVVLNALRARLSSCQDINCAEMLGKILQSSAVSNSTIAPFADLARDIMDQY